MPKITHSKSIEKFPKKLHQTLVDTPQIRLKAAFPEYRYKDLVELKQELSASGMAPTPDFKPAEPLSEEEVVQIRDVLDADLLGLFATSTNGRTLVWLRAQRKQSRADFLAELEATAPPPDGYENIYTPNPEDAKAGGWSSTQANKHHKQQFNALMAHTHAFLQDPEHPTDVPVSQLADYMSTIVSNERAAGQRRLARSTVVQMSNELLLQRTFLQMATPLLQGKIESKGFALRTPRNEMKRIVNLVLSDIHFGSDLPKTELPIESNWITQSRRLAKITVETANYKPQHRKQSKLIIHVIGDLIEGYLLHDYRGGEPLTQQFVAFMYGMSQAIAYLAQAYEEVEVRFVPGNHGRNKLRHPGRATFQKWDSYETMIMLAVQLVCSNLKNVKFGFTMKPWYSVDLFGVNMFATHGDTTLAFGNPSKNVSTKEIVAQMNNINATLMYGKKFGVFVGGHLHQPMKLDTSSGALLLNGALSPASGYADALGMLTRCGQYLFESVPGYPVGDSRLLHVGVAEDQDSKLDEILKPVRFEDLCGEI